MADARRFRFISSYPQLYIARTFTGQVTIPASPFGGFGQITIPHGLPFTPLIRGVWSNESNFSWSNDLDVRFSAEFSPTPGGNPLELTGYMATQTNIEAYFISNLSNQAVTLFVQGVCLVPSTFLGSINPFDTAGNFKFNSDFKYNQIFAQGTLPPTGGTVNHNLGYQPVCHVYAQFPGNINGQQVSSTITNTQLIVDPGDLAGVASSFYYLIFADDYI